MRHYWIAAILAFGKRNFFQSVMAAPLVAPAASFVFLGNAHKKF
jgi:hypothetical protein